MANSWNEGCVEIASRCRIDQYLRRDLRPSALPGQQADSRGQVAARAVTGHRDLRAVQTKFAAMLGHPLCGRITFFQRHGIARLRRPAVLDEDHGRAACRW